MNNQLTIDMLEQAGVGELEDLLIGHSLAIWPEPLPASVWLHPDELAGDLRADPPRLPFARLYFDTTLCLIGDEHPRILEELARLTRRRIVTAGERVPVDGEGCFQADVALHLQQCWQWQHACQDLLIAVFDF